MDSKATESSPTEVERHRHSSGATTEDARSTEAPGAHAPARARPGSWLNPATAQRLQATAGNRALAGMIAQRRTSDAPTAAEPTVEAESPAAEAPVTAPSAPGRAGGRTAADEPPGPPATDDTDAKDVAGAQSAAVPVQRLSRPPAASSPKFSALKSDVKGKQKTLSAHPPATSKSNAAQAAAKPPADDKQAQGKAANAEKMHAAQPGTFDKAAFIAAVNKAISAQAPKNLDEADNFADSGKADAVKGQVQGQVGQGKEQSAKQIETTTKAGPDTSQAKEKQVVPLAQEPAPGNPGTPNPANAVPDKAAPSATDFSEGPKQVDQQMADAQVTEDQLVKSNEPEFTGALKEKKAGEEHAATAPGQVRAAENQTLTDAKAGAQASAATSIEAMRGQKQAANTAVGQGQQGAQGKDESKRAQVTAKLQVVFDATQKDVEGILTGLDKKVDDSFSAGEKAARDAFAAEHKRRMDEYKDKRYSGFTGKMRWVKDKFAGLPEEANQIFVTARQGYVNRMQGVISNVADVIGAELNKAKQRIATGRQQLQAEIQKLPADLQAIGKEAAGEFSGKFDELTEKVDAKGQELVETLASKYNEALKSVDAEIEAEKEKNKGLIAKAVDAVKGVIDTILKLKDLLLGVLAKAAQAVMAILKDPIGFLGNLVSALGVGLKAFMSNIGTHLKKGLIGWLLGAMSGAGLQVPSKFDLRGILTMIASLLGLTWNAIRGRIIKKGIPEQAMGAVEAGVPVIAKLQSEGVAGVTEEIKEQVGDLKENLLGKISEYLIPTVLIAGITWIVSLLNPASAFIKACKMIIDIVTFIIERGAQIIEFVNAVLDAVIAIAGGGAGGVPALIEGALAKSIPVLIGALAAILGIGGVASKVKSFFQALSKPVMKAVDWIVGKIVKLGKAIWAKLKAAGKKVKDKFTGKDKDKSKGKGSKNEAAALADADQALARAGSHEAAATGVRAVERKHDVPLHLVVDSKTPQGEVVHVQTARTPQHALRDEKQTRDEIKAAMRDKHNNTLIEQVHPYWWNTYISKVRTGPLPSSPPLFSLADLKGTDSDARALTQTDGFVQPLLDYFKGNRKTADANDFYSHVFGTQNPQRKAFLQALGSPVPAELKRLAASRLPEITDEALRTSLQAGINQLGPGSYKVGVSPYGQFDLPSLRQKEHSDYFPEKINSVTQGDTTTTTYTTRAGKNFTVVEKGKDRSESLTVTGHDLNLKPSGAPRGITQTPAGFVEGEELNRAHGVADMFGGSGFREGLNLVSTSDHYNKQIQGAAERSIEASIRTFAVLNGVDVGDVSMDLTVTITFGILVGDILKARITSLPWYTASDPEAQQRYRDLLQKVSNPPIRRAEQTKYEYVLKANGKSKNYSPPPVGADVWLFVRKSES
ncbi:hypothetical protein [Streptomyces sp. NPDC000618]|uniref:phage tail protein n=1 Tax=Streptomyces sp. NPDC000618 TaxID=3154265 RepID=UPI003319879E